MKRKNYKIYSPGTIGSLNLKNRLVRSATWDPVILKERKMIPEVVDHYRQAASGGVGLIITGDFTVIPKGALNIEEVPNKEISYNDVRIEGYDLMINEVRKVAPDCKIISQISGVYPRVAPSDVPSPYTLKKNNVLTVQQIKIMIQCFIESIVGLKNDGFDGVQIHAAHGGLICRFLSPYTNRRDDEYGGSVENRVRILKEIVDGARERVGDFPILIKLNCTDFIDEGVNIENFPELALEVEKAGFDAIETSGGMRECLIRSKEELGFRPVPSAESHTYIKKPEKQSYFLKYVENLKLNIPIILVGGNRNIEILENIIKESNVDFVALCRPILCEPDLPNRWLEGRGEDEAECIACNACIWKMYTDASAGKSGLVYCLLKKDKYQIKTAEKWLSSWVDEHIVK
jgi:2,4-dienoyl-CoA reductase-like NADH-dependent reductase (Old Yellow Enzyme family)